MGHQDLQYPKDAINSVKRHRERGTSFVRDEISPIH